MVELLQDQKAGFGLSPGIGFYFKREKVLDTATIHLVLLITGHVGYALNN